MSRIVRPAATAVLLVLVLGLSWLGQIDSSAGTTGGFNYDVVVLADALDLPCKQGCATEPHGDVWSYDDPSLLARANTLRASGFFAPQTAARAESAADYARLTKQLQFDEAASVFTPSGGLQASVINESMPIVRGSAIGISR